VSRLLRGVKTRQANGIFATHLCLQQWWMQNILTASLLGSPTAESPQTLLTWTLEEWLIWHPQTNKIRRRQKKLQPQSQLTLSI